MKCSTTANNLVWRHVNAPSAPSRILPWSQSNSLSMWYKNKKNNIVRSMTMITTNTKTNTKTTTTIPYLPLFTSHHQQQQQTKDTNNKPLYRLATRSWCASHCHPSSAARFEDIFCGKCRREIMAIHQYWAGLHTTFGVQNPAQLVRICRFYVKLVLDTVILWRCRNSTYCYEQSYKVRISTL